MKKDNRQTSNEVSNEVSNNKIREWLIHHPKQVLCAGIIVLVIIIIAAAGIAHQKSMEGETEGEYSSVSEGQVTEQGVLDDYAKAEEEDALDELMSNYYTAYANADIKTLKQFVTPLSKNERGYIRVFAKYAESYEDLDIYYKNGYEDNSYFVSVAYNLKFANIDTLDPGLDFFYVRTAEDGSLYIDNIYSNFNMSSKEYDVDVEVVELINEFEKASDVIALQQDVQNRYEKALEQDKKLKRMMEKKFPKAVAEYKLEQKKEEEKAAEEEAAKKAAEEEAAKKAAEEEAAKKAAEEEAAKKAAEEEAASQAEEDTQEQSSTSQGYFDEGDVIELTSATNVRVSMSESSDRLGLAFEGETLTVIQSYAEGWTKVQWGDKTGYVRTDVLKNQ